MCCGPKPNTIVALIFQGLSLILAIVAIVAPWLIFTVTGGILVVTATLTGLTSSVPLPFPISGSSITFDRAANLLSGFPGGNNLRAAANGGSAAIACFALAIVCFILGFSFGLVRIFRSSNAPGCASSSAATVTPNSLGFTFVLIGGACGWIAMGNVLTFENQFIGAPGSLTQVSTILSLNDFLVRAFSFFHFQNGEDF
jgi:hypothetical protein